VREQTTRERWHKVHQLLGQGAGLLGCSRRLGLALNTVKRYARIPVPPNERIAPRYRPTLVDPYRDHLRTRRTAEPGMPSRTSCTRSGNRAAPAAPTCWSTTSTTEGVNTRAKKITRQMPRRSRRYSPFPAPCRR